MSYTSTYPNFVDIASTFDWRTQTTTFEPLNASETTDHLRIDNDSAMVGLITDYLLVARQWIESEINVALAQRTAYLYLDCFPSWDIEIRVPPLQSVTSIVYLDSAGTSTTLSSSLYRVDAVRKPARIEPAYQQIWPVTYPVNKAVTITVVIGYASESAVPACAKQAMRFMAKMMLDSGGIMCEDGLQAVRRMLDPLRWEGLP